MNYEDIINTIYNKTNEEIKNIKPVNILIMGKTGVGKSTLINNIFRENLAKTGIGSPVTDHIKKIKKEGIPISIYDTKGIELIKESQEDVRKEMLEELKKVNSGYNKDEYIHVGWYLVNSLSNRIEEFEIKWIEEFSKHIPIIIVLSQSIQEESSIELYRYIDNLNLKVVGIVRIVAEMYKFKETIIEPFGLKELVMMTYEVLPEGVRRAFNNAQKVHIEKKAEEATRWALGYISSTFAVGFVPIPFADAPLIASSQATMIAHITSIFGIKINRAIITSVISSLVGISGATFLGRTISGSLLKLFPATFIVGGMISGGTASIITTALAYSYINLMKFVAINEYEGKQLSSDKIKKFMKTDFKKNLKELFKRNK